MPSQLTIYNEALGHLGERAIASLSEAREPRRVLDTYWADVVAYALGQGLWKFAKRTVQADASTTLTPSFGYNCAFPAPNDFVRLIVASFSPQMDPPLLQYSYEAGIFFAQMTPLYMSYVSNDPQYGMNIGAWPEHFTDFVALRLARKACFRVTGSKELIGGLIKQEDRARRVAKAEEAMNEPPGIAPSGSWATSRSGGFGSGPGSIFSSGNG